MDKRIFSGKTKEEAIKEACIALVETEDNLYIRELETKQGLFKTKKVEIQVTTKEDIIDFMKEYLKKVLTEMGLKVNLEVMKREDSVQITLYSDNNAILIGKNGRTLEALTTVLRQAIQTHFGVHFRFLLDVEEYKEKQQANLERLAKRVAKEVAISKIAAKLDPMNSYERRIVHNALNENKKVYTESEGVEPNRYVVIKPKEEKELGE